jgi:adenylyl-sulfate kinase
MNMKASIREIDATPDQVGESEPSSPNGGDGVKLAASNIFWHKGKISQRYRQKTFGHRPATIWLTGLSGAGKSTVAYELEMMLLADGHPCFVLDGDNLRHHLNRDLGFSPSDRKENIRRAAEVARLMNEAGLIVVTSFISPYREDRAKACAIIGEDRFIEVHVSTSVEVCESRDPKGLYAKARSGQIQEFTGITSPYEPPLSPALELDTGKLSVEEAARAVHRHLTQRFV